MPHSYDYDAIVIGSGPGGEGAAMGLVKLSAERSFASLSLREVAREAGIAPTSFYRHFRDVDELGLTMVDEKWR